MRNRLPLLYATLFASALAACDGGGNFDPVLGPAPTTESNVTVTVHPGPADKDSQHYAVQFLDKEGKLIAETETEADGTAHAFITEGASVIVIGGKAAPQPTAPKDPKQQTPAWGPGGPYAVKAVLGLKPGDKIELDMAPAAEASTEKSYGTLTVPFTAKDGAAKYEITDPCSGGLIPVTATPAVVKLYSACAGKKVSLAIVAYNADGAVVGLSTAKDVEIPKAGDKPVDAKFEKMSAWADAKTFAAEVDNIEAAIDGIAFNRWSAIGFANAVALAKPAGATINQSLAVAADSAAAFQTVISAGANRKQYIVESVPADNMQYKLDLKTKLLPWIDAPTFDLAKNTIHVGTTGNTGGFDLVQARVDMHRQVTIVVKDKDADKKPRTQSYDFPLDISWTVISDKAGDIALPKLVGDLEKYNPLAAEWTPKTDPNETYTKDTVTVNGASLLDIEEAKSYDDARQIPAAGFDRAESKNVHAATETGHGARASVYVANPQ